MSKYKIYIDTTKRYEKSVSLLSLEGEQENKIETIVGNIDVVDTIQNLAKKYNVSAGDISEVTPNTGPGSFTGIKIGIVIANIINWSKGSTKVYEPEYGQEPNIQR